jgi:two-component system cell cycle response regulator DivK
MEYFAMATVLVVDDTDDSFDLVADAFEGAHSTVRARTGLEGLAQAEAVRPDLILLDMSLPGASGWDVVAELKAHPSLNHIPVIAVTAHAMDGDQQACLAAGCDDYVAKPVDVRTLVALVNEYLQTERTAKQTINVNETQ